MVGEEMRSYLCSCGRVLDKHVDDAHAVALGEPYRVGLGMAVSWKVRRSSLWVLPWKRWTGLPLPGRTEKAPLDLQAFTFFFTVLFLGSFVVDSPIRWGLSLVGLAPMIYLRDVGVLLLLCFECIRAAQRKKISLPLGLALLAVSFHFFVGVLSIGNIVQPLFGFKILLPLFLGLLAGRRVREAGRETSFHRILMILWMISLAGVLLQAIRVPMPWTGFSVEIGDVKIEGNRAWTAQGINRLSGFGRASFDTSLILLLLPCTFLFGLQPSWRWLVLLASLVGIVLTTTKVTILACLATIGILGLLSFRFPLVGAFRLCALGLCAILTLAPPILLRPGAFGIDLSNPAINLAFGSFMDRIYNTWPHGYDLLEASPMPLVGRGLGGVGAAQVYFEADNYNPGDNLYVYARVATGVFAWVYIGVLFFVGIPTRNGESRRFFLFVCVIFVLGLTMNVIESATALFLIGYLTVVRRTYLANPGAKSLSPVIQI